MSEASPAAGEEKDNPKYDTTAKSLFAPLQKAHLARAEATAFVECAQTGGWGKLADGWLDNVNASVCRRMSVSSLASARSQLQGCSNMGASSIAQSHVVTHAGMHVLNY